MGDDVNGHEDVDSALRDRLEREVGLPIEQILALIADNAGLWQWYADKGFESILPPRPPGGYYQRVEVVEGYDRTADDEAAWWETSTQQRVDRVDRRLRRNGMIRRRLLGRHPGLDLSHNLEAMMKTKTFQRPWSMADIGQFAGVSHRTVQRWRKSGDLPEPINYVGESPRFRAGDVLVALLGDA
jgi:hypothetical protein